MLNDPLAGRDLRAPEGCRMLVATENGVFLWSGSALVYRRGNGFFAAPSGEANSQIGAFFGPAAIYTPIQTVLELARDELRAGRTAAVQRMLDRLPLPPISPNGARLMQAIANRQELRLPNLAVATEQSGTNWNDRDIELFAKLHDGVGTRSQSLEKIFNPGSAWDPAKHPRWPSGQSDGGEFRPGDGAETSDLSPIHPIPVEWPRNDPDGPGDPPKIPDKEPESGRAANAVRKAVVRWLVRAAATAADVVAPEVVLAVQAAAEAVGWVWPYVSSYLDKPKTLEELQAAVQNPREGYEVHHIVEQTPAEKDGIPRSQIDDKSNLALVPKLKHWELTGWFMTANKKHGGLTPRECLKGKDWGTRRSVGLDGLRAVGVLKP